MPAMFWPRGFGYSRLSLRMVASLLSVSSQFRLERSVCIYGFLMSTACLRHVAVKWAESSSSALLLEIPDYKKPLSLAPLAIWFGKRSYQRDARWNFMQRVDTASLVVSKIRFFQVKPNSRTKRLRGGVWIRMEQIQRGTINEHYWQLLLDGLYGIENCAKPGKSMKTCEEKSKMSI